MANLLERAVEITYDFINSELRDYDGEELIEMIRQLNNIAINPGLLLNERDRLTFQKEINYKYDSDVISIVNDAAMDLYIRLESDARGTYGVLVGIVDDCIAEVSSSSIVPDEWKEDMPGETDLGHVLRLILGYVMRDFAVTDGPGAE